MVCDSRTSGRSAQFQRFSKMADRDRSLPRIEALKYGTEMLDLGDITLKEKQYEVLKLLY